MSQLEVDGEAEDPFGEAEDTEETPSGEGDAPVDESGETPSEPVEPVSEPSTTTGSTGSQPQASPRQERNSRDSTVGMTVSDLTVGEDVNPAVIAQALTDTAYARENPPVPYAVWREGVSVGRQKRTLDINNDLDALVKQVADEFEARHGTDVYKADVRELAMAYGLMHVEELFEMMSEWGVEYDK